MDRRLTIDALGWTGIISDLVAYYPVSSKRLRGDARCASLPAAESRRRRVIDYQLCLPSFDIRIARQRGLDLDLDLYIEADFGGKAKSICSIDHSCG